MQKQQVENIEMHLLGNIPHKAASYQELNKLVNIEYGATSINFNNINFTINWIRNKKGWENFKECGKDADALLARNKQQHPKIQEELDHLIFEWEPNTTPLKDLLLEIVEVKQKKIDLLEAKHKATLFLHAYKNKNSIVSSLPPELISIIACTFFQAVQKGTRLDNNPATSANETSQEKNLQLG